MRNETFPTPGHVVLDLRLTAGEIHVEALDVHETSVRTRDVAVALARPLVPLRD